MGHSKLPQLAKRDEHDLSDSSSGLTNINVFWMSSLAIFGYSALSIRVQRILHFSLFAVMDRHMRSQEQMRPAAESKFVVPISIFLFSNTSPSNDDIMIFRIDPPARGFSVHLGLRT
jgi:hypothetical protein